MAKKKDDAEVLESASVEAPVVEPVVEVAVEVAPEPKVEDQPLKAEPVLKSESEPEAPTYTPVTVSGYDLRTQRWS